MEVITSIVGVFSTVGMFVFLVMSIIARFKKNGKAKRNLLSAAGCFALMVIMMVADPNKSTTDGAKEAGAATPGAMTTVADKATAPKPTPTASPVVDPKADSEAKAKAKAEEDAKKTADEAKITIEKFAPVINDFNTVYNQFSTAVNQLSKGEIAPATAYNQLDQLKNQALQVFNESESLKIIDRYSKSKETLSDAALFLSDAIKNLQSYLDDNKTSSMAKAQDNIQQAKQGIQLVNLAITEQAVKDGYTSPSSDLPSST